ncbi:MAG: IS110 family transposase [Hyphomicrobium sp.]
MARLVLAVGIDPAKRIHHAAAVLYPDRLILDTAFANNRDAIVDFDTKVVALAAEHNAQLIYGIEDHRRYGRALAQALQQAGREIRVVNPLWTHRQKDFYGQDKYDRIDARSVAAVVLRRADKLPDASDASALSAAIREAERTLDELARQRTRAFNRLHGHLSDVYLASYETFFSSLKKPCASLRAFRYRKTSPTRTPRISPAPCRTWPASTSARSASASANAPTTFSRRRPRCKRNRRTEAWSSRRS